VTTALRRRIRHARRWTGYGVLVVLIVVALMVGVANQMLPMVERHPDRIAAWLSARVGEPVSFSKAHGEWTRRGPRFILDDLHVGKGATELAIGRAQLQVAMYSGLLPGHPLTELKIRDLLLTLVQDADGRWKVVGLPGQTEADPLDRLEGFGELQIERAQLTIRAPKLKVDMHVPRVDARVRVNGPRLRVGVSAWVEAGDLPVSAVLDVHRITGNGLLWVGGDKIVLSHWHRALASVGVVPEQGKAKLGVWAKLQDRRVRELTLDAEIEQARMHSAQPLRLSDGSSRPARMDFDRLEASARWHVTANGWQLIAPRLNIAKAGKVAHLDQLVIDDGRQFRLSGPQLDLAPLAAIVSLSDRFPDPVRVFLQQSSPQALLRDVRILGSREGRMSGSMIISRLELQPFAKRPGVSGLAGKIQFDERGGVMRIEPGTVHVNWPGGLRQPVDFQLTGTIAAWDSGPGWSVGFDRLQLKGSDFGADVRAELVFQGDGSAPMLDLAADLAPSSFATAKKFWILNKMPESTVRWLDTALVEGQVLDGRVTIGGDLDDWPFRNNTGRFDARANIRGATLKFNENWPAGEAMDLDVTFNGPGMEIAGVAMLRGNPVKRLVGGIADFHAPVLKLEIDSDTRGEPLRQLMMESSLNREYGEHLKAATIGGVAKVALLLDLPLREGLGEKRIEGTLDLDRASLADSRWDIAFSQVSGRTRFSQHGFATEDLRVLFSNQPGVFNLRVGQQVGDATLAALATLDGRFAGPTLLDRYEDLAWLKPWMTGNSNWKLAVRIPKAVGKRQPPSQLRVTSDLVGTSLSMPEPFRKPAGEALPLDLQLALPIEQGEMNLRLGNLMRMRALMRKNQPIAGAMQFGEGALATIPAKGISVRGTAPVVDATGWVAFSGKGSSASTINDVNLQASQLIFLDRAFADARLDLSRSAAMTVAAFKGKGIEGSIEIPTESSRPVQGRFARLYLPSDSGPAQPASADPGEGVAASSMVVEDPAALPPLRFSIADLRIGQAQLGKAELATSPMPTGMRIEKFQTQAKNLNLSAAGEWVRTVGGTRSNFRLEFAANSLGQMLDALGYKDMVQGGKTKATLAGSWSGSPGAFALATLSGSLKLDVGEGRLLDVEPGGSGRILGLISLAEIPRRLSLDFSDFFQKGFSFNTARGDFTFNDGKARTDNLRIDGPAAEVRVSGETGLREQVYDQRVEVLPKAGGILPAIGLLAGGPAGAAVGAMAQAVLQRPLKQTTRVVYKVSGPWAKPVTKIIERGPARTPEAPAKPSVVPPAPQTPAAATPAAPP
jgi:uncharacterized protein (TIGR02099 family)